jgi:hypothetical protein
MRIGKWIIMKASTLPRKPNYEMLQVVAWILDRLPEEADALAKQIIRRVYGGKRSIHRNPVRKIYPLSMMQKADQPEDRSFANLP